MLCLRPCVPILCPKVFSRNVLCFCCYLFSEDATDGLLFYDAASRCTISPRRNYRSSKYVSHQHIAALYTRVPAQRIDGPQPDTNQRSYISSRPTFQRLVPNFLAFVRLYFFKQKMRHTITAASGACRLHRERNGERKKEKREKNWGAVGGYPLNRGVPHHFFVKRGSPSKKFQIFCSAGAHSLSNLGHQSYIVPDHHQVHLRRSEGWLCL